MLSLETSQKLNDAGLFTKIHKGDAYYRFDGKLTLYLDWTTAPISPSWLCPRLDQILSEIEARGYSYTLERHGSKDDVRYSLLLMEWDEKVAEIDFGNGWSPLIDFYANTPEEAAAAALLWILERDADG